jgi:hypothetical protein
MALSLYADNKNLKFICSKDGFASRGDIAKKVEKNEFNYGKIEDICFSTSVVESDIANTQISFDSVAYEKKVEYVKNYLMTNLDGNIENNYKVFLFKMDDKLYWAVYCKEDPVLQRKKR